MDIPIPSLGKVFDSIVDSVIPDGAVSDLIKGGLEIGFAVMTGDVMTGINGAKNVFDGIQELKEEPKVEYPARGDLSEAGPAHAASVVDPAPTPGAILPPLIAPWLGEARMEEAVEQLHQHFDLLDTAAGIGGRDGVIARCDLEAAAKNPGLDPKLREACQFLLDNPAAFNQLSANVGAADGFIRRDDLNAHASAPAAPLPAPTPGNAPVTSTSAPVSSTGAPGGASEPGGARRSDRFKGLSPEQIVQLLMLEMLNGIDEEMVNAADELAAAQEANIAAAKNPEAYKTEGSSDGKAKADAAGAKQKAATAENRATMRLQDLVQKRQAMFQMLSNFQTVTHEMAKAAIQNMGRA
jgi:hypothetical protein